VVPKKFGLYPLIFAPVISRVRSTELSGLYGRHFVGLVGLLKTSENFELWAIFGLKIVP